MQPLLLPLPLLLPPLVLMPVLGPLYNIGACASIYDAGLAYTFGPAAARRAAGFDVISFPAAGRDGYG